MFYSYVRGTTLSSSSVAVLPVDGIEKLRIEAKGDALFYTLWPALENTKYDDVGASVATQIAAGVSGSAIVKLHVNGAGTPGKYFAGMALEIRESNGTALRCTATVLPARKYGESFRDADLTVQRANFIVVHIHGAAAGDIVATDQIFLLNPSASDKRGILLEPGQDSHCIDVPSWAKGIALARYASTAVDVNLGAVWCQ